MSQLRYTVRHTHIDVAGPSTPTLVHDAITERQSESPLYLDVGLSIDEALVTLLVLLVAVLQACKLG